IVFDTICKIRKITICAGAEATVSELTSAHGVRKSWHREQAGDTIRLFTAKGSMVAKNLNIE
ncbi:MAG: hypothetical protein QME49_10220, partial [bacterium]|nr:hypothetical protein [bacterium]